MKISIKTSAISIAIAPAFIVSSCASSKKETNAMIDNMPQETTAAECLKGKWSLERIVLNDSVKACPSESLPDSDQFIVFEDDTYYIQTNCNSISGGYSLKGDSISMGDGIMTEMACDNMDTEDALRIIMPNITNITVENDSITRLCTNKPSDYILLHKVSV